MTDSQLHLPQGITSIPFGSNLSRMQHGSAPVISQHTKFEVPGFAYSKDMIDGKI